MPAPAGDTPIYHITHLENLAGIVAQGIVCDNLIGSIGGARSIAYPSIKAQRAATPVPVGPGGTVADYVPFYFTPRSPMLYTIYQNNVPGAEGTHGDIVHLVATAQAVAAVASGFVFTNGHAVMTLSDFFADLNDLGNLDWASIKTTKWGSYYDPTDETKRKKQSEFLAYQRIPWEAIQSIGVLSAACQAKVEAVLQGVAHHPTVVVRPDWYY